MAEQKKAALAKTAQYGDVSDFSSTWEQVAPKNSLSQRKVMSRTFSALGYPDSLAQNWVSMLDDLHVACAISPLHNRDVNPSTGLLKKPHYHVVFVFEGRKKLGQVEDMLDGTGLIRVRAEPALNGVLRYLIHLDNACDDTDGRHRYSADEITVLGPLDIAPYLAAKHGERAKAISAMRDWIRQARCIQFGDFMDYVDSSRPDWALLLCERGTQSQIEQFIRARYRENLPVHSTDEVRIRDLEDQVASLRAWVSEISKTDRR